MNTDPRQIVLVLLAVGVTLWLLRPGRERWLLAWIGLTMFVQIFDTTILTNLPVGRLVGLLALPRVFAGIKTWSRLKPIRAWLVNFAYLLVLGAAFGVLWPWPDITLVRPFSLTAPGRVVVYSVRLLSDFSLALLVARQLYDADVLFWLGRAMVVGSTLTALAGLLYFVSGVDLYFPITGLAEQGLLIGRARGFSIEPRALGLACAYGTMILLLGRQKIARLWPLLLLINLLGLLITYSASSLVLLGMGIVTASLFFSNRERALVLGVAGLAIVITVLAYIYAPQQVDFAITTLQMRLDPDFKLSGIPPGNWAEEIAYRLDVFDASALLFLLDQPLYALLGTGPGLVTLPASYYVPPGLYSNIWTAETGINSLPFHGWLLEIANSGVLGLALWIMQVAACWSALRFLAARHTRRSQRAGWRFGYALFVVGVVSYMVQVSSSPVWAIFLGIGWAATALAETETVRASAIARQEASLLASLAPDWRMTHQQESY
jgi:hypothetical protein